jgi:hypothetical protein
MKSKFAGHFLNEILREMNTKTPETKKSNQDITVSGFEKGDKDLIQPPKSISPFF